MNRYLKEIRATSVLGIPLVIAQLAMMAMALTDAIMVGRGVGTEALAAMAFGLSFMNIPCMSLYGIGTATSIYTAHAFGSGKTGELPVILRHGLVLSLLASIVVVALMLWLFGHLGAVNYLGQPPELIPLARPYLNLYGVAFIFMLCGGNLRAYCESQNRPWLPLYVVIGSIALNAVLDYTLIYGVFGLPKMGLVGAGIATLFSSIAQVVALLAVILHTKSLHLTLPELLRPEMTRAFVKRHLKLAIPTALQIGVEIAGMSVMALFAGMLGTKTLAAHHITMQVGGFAFMVPMGMSFAVSIRVSQAAGSNDRSFVRRVCESGILFAVCWTAVFSVVILLLRGKIPWFFTHDAEVARIATGFILILGLYHVFDGLQCTAVGALRGLKDVNIPTVIVILTYWVFEIPLAWVLCFHLHLGGLGIWLAFLFGLILGSILLTGRLNRISTLRGFNNPEPPAAS